MALLDATVVVDFVVVVVVDIVVVIVVVVNVVIVALFVVTDHIMFNCGLLMLI